MVQQRCKFEAKFTTANRKTNSATGLGLEVHALKWNVATRILDCDSFTLIWIVEEAGVVHFSSRREVISKFLARIVSFPLNVLSVESVRVWSEIQICGKCAKARYLTSISQRQLLTPLCSVKVSRRSTLPEGAATVNFAPRQGEGKEQQVSQQQQPFSRCR
ncbi:uncharacterized protein LOC134215629 [Armigeres subalbatus]|uniref:uncharacterized protein LOC134215629 n=1 Tax=Armigeres subalbatus TaxID=124917 RepID=UPI002ED04A84